MRMSLETNPFCQVNKSVLIEVGISVSLTGKYFSFTSGKIFELTG